MHLILFALATLGSAHAADLTINATTATYDGTQSYRDRQQHDRRQRD